MSKNRIINQLVLNAATIMESKAEEQAIIAQLLEEKGDHDTAARLRETNKRIAAAIDLMRENEGCWA